MRAIAALCGAGVIVALVVLGACGSFGGQESPPTEAEAGGPGVDAADPDAQAEPPEDDGGVVLVPLDADTDAGVDAACPVLPKAATNATPSPATGIVCNPNGALTANDGVVAGLDYASGGALATVAGVNVVSSCVALDFGAGVFLNDATVRLAANHNACGIACTTLCGTYDRASIFFSAQPASSGWTFAGHAELTSTLLDFPFPIPAGVMARYVIVCRTGGGGARDDVVVDAVTGHCR
jgi:hypothetical protein